ncbi:MAG: VOC family protein [Gemmatimonadaceae bacterium]
MTPNTPITGAATQRGQPESFRAISLSASLTVKDLESSVAWYRDAIGFIVDQEYKRDGRVLSVALKAGTVRILLNQDDGAKGTDRVKGEGISLMLTTAQDIDQLARRVKAAGGTLITEPADMPWGARAFRAHDPDGFKLAFSSERNR